MLKILFWNNKGKGFYINIVYFPKRLPLISATPNSS